jgi:hypothetical protein
MTAFKGIGKRDSTSMSRVVIQLAAGAAFLVFVWRMFRFAMALRSGRLAREDARRSEEADGRRIVAELPGADGRLDLFAEDATSFHWSTGRVAKANVIGCRLLLNGGVMAQAARPGVTLPDAAAVEEYEGRERWDVRVYTATGSTDIACGRVREGVSREAAQSVFAAIKAVLSA